MRSGGAGRELRKELDRQVENLIAKGYPKLAGREAGELMRQVAALEPMLPDPRSAGDSNRIPFLAVARGVVADRAMPLVELRGKQGFTDMGADDLERFAPIEGVKLPHGLAYLVIDVEMGRDTLNVTPDAALDTIANDGRSPLTIDEGVALVTHYPAALETMNCFSILGSRCGDRRVTAIWLSGGRPRLGWCWAGNPHTWLGSASCASRIGP